jgi:hypothetical protein
MPRLDLCVEATPRRGVSKAAFLGALQSVITPGEWEWVEHLGRNFPDVLSFYWFDDDREYLLSVRDDLLRALDPVTESVLTWFEGEWDDRMRHFPAAAAAVTITASATRQRRRTLGPWQTHPR